MRPNLGGVLEDVNPGALEDDSGFDSRPRAIEADIGAHWVRGPAGDGEVALRGMDSRAWVVGGLRSGQVSTGTRRRFRTGRRDA